MESAQQALDETPTLELEQILPPKEQKPPSAKEIMFVKVKELQAKGYSGSVISRMLSLSRVPVNRYLQHQMLPAYSSPKTGIKFIASLDFISRHWQESNGNRLKLFC